jgi:signal transduction histidine kinase
MKKILDYIKDSLNIKKEAEELGVRIWQTPSVLFIFLGIIIVVAMTGIYFIPRNYDYPEVIVISESLVVAILFSIGNFMIRGIEGIARANKIKTEFVSIASHQLKTPLSEINWELELLLKRHQEGLNDRQKEIMLSIAKSNNRMARLVNDLLDVARIDQGRLALAKEWIDMGKVIEDVVDNNRFMAETAGVKLSAVIPKSYPKIIADKRRVGVVLDNLVSNSIKYSNSAGSVMINLENKGGFLMVCVSDDGVGIPKSQQDKVFQKFFRSDNIVKNQTEGTGLGLYIAKNIVEQSGGKMWFESEEKKGTSFWFSLPCSRADAVIYS